VNQGNFPEAEENLAEASRIEPALGYVLIKQQRELRRGHLQLATVWAQSDPAKAPRIAEWQKKLDELEATAASAAGRKP